MARRRRNPFVAYLIPPVAGSMLVAGSLILIDRQSVQEIFAPAAGTVSLPGDMDIPPLERVGPPDRDVTAGGVTPGPQVEGALLRVPADIKPAALARAPETLYRRVLVLEAGRLRAVAGRSAVVIQIAGIKAPSFKESCTDREGRVWKCGARARAELARLIGSRGVSCIFGEADATQEEIVGNCRVGTFDLAEWLVKNGWADPATGLDGKLNDLAAEAKAAGRGRYGPAPSFAG